MADYHPEVVAWVERHGSPSQKARLADRLLDPDEVYQAQRAALFARLGDVPRYARMRDEGVRRYLGFPPGARNHVTYASGPAEHLPPYEYEQMQAIKAFAPPGATVEPRQHVATCERRRIVILTASVSVEWAGRTLVYEYQLSKNLWRA